MSEPTPVVRAVTYERDGERCVSCGAWTGLQYQHRRAEGMGGRVARPKLEEGVTSCGTCNPDYEGPRQTEALRFGWKVRSWVADQGRAAEVPVFYTIDRGWYVLDGGRRRRVSERAALVMMREVYGDEYDAWEVAA